MVYERTTWENREVERPRTYEVVDNPDGTITLIPSEGNIISEGTPIVADNMNNIEEGIETALSETDELDDRVGPLNALLTNAKTSIVAAINSTITDLVSGFSSVSGQLDAHKDNSTGHGVATSDVAKEGTSNTAYMTPLRTKEAIDALQAVKTVNGRVGTVEVSKSDVGLGSVDNSKQMPIAGGTFTGRAYAQANTAYTTAQIRNIRFSTADASGTADNGTIWIKYK